RTGSITVSKTLAAYLNLDMTERLASRRATGGTRPALDYPALLSIPVIYDERIPALMGQAVRRYQEQLREAQSLHESINGLLLDELGIVPPSHAPNSLKRRIFKRAISELSGGRLDPIAQQPR